VVLAALLVAFFRDPERQAPDEADLVISPADARITVAGDPPGPGGPPGQWRHISMFLSLLDVHVNRVPVTGTVGEVSYHAGRFLPAYKPDAGELNEWTEVWFDCDGRPVVCRQIVGILARRIVCRIGPGDRVERGQRFGVMKFGSRIDLFLPPDATILVEPGQKVSGGRTPVARLAAAPS
jgi:phosphatidylserine decarboxylase